MAVHVLIESDEYTESRMKWECLWKKKVLESLLTVQVKFVLFFQVQPKATLSSWSETYIRHLAIQLND